MLSEPQALEIAKTQIRASQSTRAAMESLCAVYMLYTYGSQWGRLGVGTRGGQSVRRLKPIWDPDSPNVRCAVNEIRRCVQKINSRLEPRKLEFDVLADSPASNDRIAARVGQKRMDAFCREVNARRYLRAGVRWRTVLGSVIVRRTMWTKGKVALLRDPDNKPQERKDGSYRTIRTFGHGWQICPPYEFIRDPAANDPTFEGENYIGHEKPVPVDHVVRFYGKGALPRGEGNEIKGTMGRYMHVQQLIYRATNTMAGARPDDSKTPALLLSEHFFRDPDAEGENDWPWRLLAYRDAYGTEANQELHRLEFGRNPYQDLPMHHFVYDAVPAHAWGSGIPEQTIGRQNLINLGWTGFLRSHLLHSGGFLMVEKDAIVGEITDLLAQRYNKPIEVNPGARHWPPIVRETGPGIDQVSATFIQRGPEMIENSLNLSAVQWGITSKRGESSKAVERKQEQADTPITARIDEDEITTNELLTGTLYDIGKTATLKDLGTILSGEFSDMELATFLHQDFSKAGIGVRVTQDSLRPRTPREYREEYTQLIESGMVEPVDARRAMLVNGVAILPLESLNYDLQMEEVRRMLRGYAAKVTEDQDHPTHLFAIGVVQARPGYDQYSEQQRSRIEGHASEHKEYMQLSQVTQREFEAPLAEPGIQEEPYPIEPQTQGPGPVLPFPQEMGMPGVGPATQQVAV